MFAPPLYVAAPITTDAVVEEVVEALTDEGGPGKFGTTPSVSVVVPVDVAPPATVVVAVTVYVSLPLAIVGVPEITPVAVSRVRPAGSGPAIE